MLWGLQYIFSETSCKSLNSNPHPSHKKVHRGSSIPFPMPESGLRKHIPPKWKGSVRSPILFPTPSICPVRELHKRLTFKIGNLLLTKMKVLSKPIYSAGMQMAVGSCPVTVQEPYWGNLLGLLKYHFGLFSMSEICLVFPSLIMVMESWLSSPGYLYHCNEEIPEVTRKILGQW